MLHPPLLLLPSGRTTLSSTVSICLHASTHLRYHISTLSLASRVDNRLRFCPERRSSWVGQRSNSPRRLLGRLYFGWDLGGCDTRHDSLPSLASSKRAKSWRGICKWVTSNAKGKPQHAVYESAMQSPQGCEDDSPGGAGGCLPCDWDVPRLPMGDSASSEYPNMQQLDTGKPWDWWISN
jgi:hypothetical protein